MPDRNATTSHMVVFLMSLAAALLSACLSGAGGKTPGNTDGSSSGGTSSGGASSGGTSSGGTSSGGTSSGGTSSGGATQCISDRVPAPSDSSCACAWDNCDATKMTCTCGLSCYGDADKKCVINVNPGDGSASTSDGTLGKCKVACSPESDLSTKIVCSAEACEHQPNQQVNINPNAPTAPVQTAQDAERKVSAVEVMFVVDNSSSMQDNQMASACALDSFFNAAGKNGAKYETGVLTTDLLCDVSKCTATYSENGKYTNPPTPVSLSGTCSATVSCSANSCEGASTTGQTCQFSDNGKLVPSDDKNSQDQLRKLVVQGEKGSHREGGLEKAFQYFADQERKGTFDANTSREIVVISDEEANADDFLCPFNAVDRNTSGIKNFSPPTPKNTRESCIQDLIDFYSYYFKSRNVIVHGLLYTKDCTNSGAEETGTIYEAVIKATGGHEDSICACTNFDKFFDDVGKSTSTLSTELCFASALPDPNTIEVQYVDPSGTKKTVPQSAQDGWTLDANLKCLVMNGSWKDVYGKFHIVYNDPNAQPVPTGEPKACLAQDVNPIVSTIQVSCNGKDVPQSDTNGYTYNATDHCFTFHGKDWASVDGASCSVKFI
jgi:hypothetical protein